MIREPDERPHRTDEPVDRGTVGIGGLQPRLRRVGDVWQAALVVQPLRPLEQDAGIGDGRPGQCRQLLRFAQGVGAAA